MPQAQLEDRSLTVLIANDHEWSVRSLETILEAAGYRVVRAHTGRQALERAAQDRPDAIVLDLQMPDLDGLEVCRTIRAMPALGPVVPIFITTAGASGRTERLSAYQAGAWEFFGQPLDGEAVLLKLKTFIESKVVVDALRRDSLIDEVTGLYNRRGLLLRAQELASDATRRGVALTGVVLVPAIPSIAAEDADRWASRIGEVIRASGRSSDAIGRLGALEFGIVAVAGGAAEPERLIQRMSEAASRWSGPADDPAVALRGAYCSMGDQPNQPLDPEHMLDLAASAVYQASPAPAERAAGG